MFSLSLQLMFYGLTGVFIALSILYIAVKAIVMVFPYDTKEQ
jgi:Na+-transporting methylmalonyl-CoA/oxaloacetate decarboxylase gamma subunit